MLKEKTVCFTGHRPEKLPGHNNPNDTLLAMIKSMLHYRIYSAIQSGYEFFISGLARGVDLWAAESVLSLKKEFPHIKLIGAKPYSSHGKNFSGEDLWTFNNVIKNADKVICVSDNYSQNCYKMRNYFMVDNSSFLIGVVENFRSGTGQTISYARKKGLNVSLINVAELKKVSDYSEESTKIRFD